MMSTSTSGSSSRMSTCTSGFTQPSAISPRLSSSSNGWHCQSMNEPPFAVQFYGVSTQEKGMSQGKLSRSADVDIKTLRRIYRQPTTIVTTETLGKLAKALGVDASALIETAPEQ